MPEVSRFYGIIVRFYYRDHPPKNFHAIYGQHEALIEIETGAVYEGHLPKTAFDLVNQWGIINRVEANRRLQLSFVIVLGLGLMIGFRCYT